MKTRTRFGFAAASLIVIAGSASAATIGQFTTAGGTAITDMQPYIGGGGGVSGNNFVLDAPDGSGISLGLKSHNRFAGDWATATLDGSRGVYQALPGVYPGDSGSNSTMWSYLYAVDFADGIDASLYGVRLKLDFDAADGDVADGDWYTIEFEGNSDSTQGASESMGFDWFDPNNPALPVGFELEGYTGPWPTGGTASFSGTGNYIDIDPNVAGRYDVEVEVYLISSGAVLAEAAMSVVVVPLPPAAWAGLAGLAGAAVMRRRFTT